MKDQCPKCGAPCAEIPATPQAGTTAPSEREAFEAWIRKDAGDLSTFGSGQNLHYRNSAVNNAWGGWERRAALTQPTTVQQAEPDGWRAALQFYADRSHFSVADDDAWDTVSGEPQNFWCDEAGTATIEDGTVAAMALAGTPLRDADEEAPQGMQPGERKEQS